jgi:hypothetical protein
MSVPVDVADLRDHIEAAGSRAFLVSVGTDHRAHVVSTRVQWLDGYLHATAGRRTRANLAVQPALTLLWPAEPGGPFSLIVDGEVAGDPAVDDPLPVRPVAAVLHRSDTN